MFGPVKTLNLLIYGKKNSCLKQIKTIKNILWTFPQESSQPTL